MTKAQEHQKLLTDKVIEIICIVDQGDYEAAASKEHALYVEAFTAIHQGTCNASVAAGICLGIATLEFPRW